MADNISLDADKWNEINQRFTTFTAPCSSQKNTSTDSEWLAKLEGRWIRTSQTKEYTGKQTIAIGPGNYCWI